MIVATIPCVRVLAHQRTFTDCQSMTSAAETPAMAMGTDQLMRAIWKGGAEDVFYRTRYVALYSAQAQWSSGGYTALGSLGTETAGANDY